MVIEKELKSGTKEYHIMKAKEWQGKNPIRHRKNCIRWQKDNPEKVRKYVKKSKLKNIERSRRNSRNWIMNKKKTDINYRIKSIVRIRIYDAVKNNRKKSSSTKLLGMDIQSYKEYLESQFDENMSWDNYGSYWEIDHIKQLCTFDLSKPKQQLEAFNYKNTRPLEKSLNRRRAKRD